MLTRAEIEKVCDDIIAEYRSKMTKEFLFGESKSLFGELPTGVFSEPIDHNKLNTMRHRKGMIERSIKNG